MGEKQITPIVVDDVEYTFEDMTSEQQMMVKHIADLDRKVGSAQFNLDQLRVGKEAFVQMLKTSLAKEKDDGAAHD